MQFPFEVEKIFDLLHENGFQGYAVGGCVRDALMGRIPYDFDIATDALPEQVLEVFLNETVIPTGIRHGTVTVVINGIPVEITTFRRDGDYLDNRRPSSVVFAKNVKDDLCRRDFTVNAIAYNHSVGIVDYFGGINDLKRGLIRCVGKSEDRFNEDALRILRALRLAAQLGFRIEEETARGIHEKKHLLCNISCERINAEFSRLLLSDHCAVHLITFQDVAGEFIEGAGDDPEFIKKAERIQNARGDLSVRLALLLEGLFDWKRAFVQLKTLKYDNATVREATMLIRCGNATIKKDKKRIRLWLNRLGDEGFLRLLDFKESKEDVKALRDIALKIIKNNECYSLRRLMVNGNDLILAGIAAGKETGWILKRLLLAVMLEKIPNEPGILLKQAGIYHLNYFKKGHGKPCGMQ